MKGGGGGLRDADALYDSQRKMHTASIEHDLGMHATRDRETLLNTYIQNCFLCNYVTILKNETVVAEARDWLTENGEPVPGEGPREGGTE